MLALTLQTFLIFSVAYVAGALLGCVLRRASFAWQAATTAAPVRRVDPLPSALSGARFSPGDKAAPVARETSSAPATITVAPSSAVMAAAEEPTKDDDLQRIRSIDPQLESALNRLGVSRYQQIAGWMRQEVKDISKALGLGGRINQENWIEQAQILANGGETSFASGLSRGLAASASPTPHEGEALAATKVSLTEPSSPNVSERAAFAREHPPALTGGPIAVPAGAPPAATPIRPAAAPARDNLQRISGIDAEVEQQLIEHGVTSYGQIANWLAADVERFGRQFASDGRISRENWVEQAQILSRGGDTQYSRDYDRRLQGEGGSPSSAREVKLDAAIREHAATTHGSDLGSVRSSSNHSVALGAVGRFVHSGAPNDLKRIRGIGVHTETRLKAMGIVSYEQIANWSADDIDRVSQSLEFKGRIERENWVEQARILASGGDTEFSRRVDRGEVETSRYRT